MGMERRRFPRVKADLKIAYEFVHWKDKNLINMIDPIYAKIFDISASGIGLFNLTGLNEKLLKLLEKGDKKIRLAIYLYENKPPLITFARLIWHNWDSFKNTEKNKLERYGFIFLDVTNSFFEEVKNFVDNHLKEK